jgi:CopG family transcriptional regulator/antitoxin EndoAI
MAIQETGTYKRVNITLPQATLTLIDRVTQKSNRSAFLDRAVRFYVAEAGRENLKKRLKEGAQARQDRDRNVAEDWFPIESDT